jgi:MFS family permease
VVVVGVVQILSQGAGSSLFALLLLPLESSLGWNRATLTAAFSLSSLVLAAVLIPIGGVVDRYGSRVVLIAGGIVSGLSLFGLTWVRQPWQLDLVLGVGFGVALALTSVQVGATSIANWFVRRRGAALGWLSVFMGLAVPVCVPIINQLILWYGWRIAVDILAAAFLALIIPVAIFVRHRPEDVGLHPDGDGSPSQDDHGSAAEVGFQSAIAGRGFWILSIASILPAIAWGIVNTQQIAYMVGIGFASAFAAGIVSVAGLASLPGRFVLNAAADWFGPKLILIILIALQAVGILVLINAASWVGLLCYSILYGVSTGSAFGVRNAWLGGLFGRKAFGAITALHGTMIYVGGAIGPVTGGALYDHFGNYKVAFTIAWMITAVSILGLFFVPSPRRVPARALVRGAR